MSLQIELFYDYVCPFCYLGEVPFERAIEGMDVEVKLCPFELRRPPVPKVDPMHDEAKIQRFNEVLYPAAQELGVEMKLPWISPHPYTTLTFQGFYYAKEFGKETEYNHAIFHRFYVDEQDIGEMPVIQSVLEQLGLDPAGMEAVAAEGRYLEQLDADKAYAKQREVKSIPTFIIGSQRLTGIHTVEEFRQAMADAEAEAAEMEGMHCGEDGCDFGAPASTEEDAMGCGEDGCKF